MEMLNVALVGAGRMGQLRAPILYANPRVALVCVVESDAVRAEALATRFHTRHYTTLSDAKLHLPHINSIVLCTPTFTHSLAIKEAATLGLHIFTEKPISEDSTEIQQSYRVCQEHNVTLCCGFQRRFDKSYINMRNAIKSGKIGDPKMIHVFFADHRK
jgi:myo-inositol 2-dehydrogenase/D-chiro-inositol 1-dehydrogenase